MSHEFLSEKYRPLVGLNDNLFLADPISGSLGTSTSITGFFAKVVSILPFYSTQVITSYLPGYNATMSQPGTTGLVQLAPTAQKNWALDLRVIPLDNFELQFYQDASTPLYSYQNGQTFEGPVAFSDAEEEGWTPNEIIYFQDNAPYVMALNYMPYPLTLARVKLVGWQYGLLPLSSTPAHYTIAMMSTKPKQTPVPIEPLPARGGD
jgi:hypothetical protein